MFEKIKITGKILLLNTILSTLLGGIKAQQSVSTEQESKLLNPTTGYAVLVAGTTYEDSEYGDIKNKAIIELGEVYQRLKGLGFDEKNIYLNISGKPNIESLDEQVKKEFETKIQKGTLETSSRKEDILKRIGRLSDKIDENDILCLYFVGEGYMLRFRNEKEDKKESYLEIRRSLDTITKDELKDVLNGINPATGLVYMGQCQSYTFNEIGKTNDNYIVINASQIYRNAISTNEFSFGRYFFESLMEREADSNNDGDISIEEAFKSASKKFDSKQKQTYREDFHPDYKKKGKIEPKITAKNPTLYKTSINLRNK